jgi:cell division protein FtsB
MPVATRSGHHEADDPRRVYKALTQGWQAAAMIVRTRLRRFLYPLALYCVAGSIGSFFFWHAVNGDRGLKVSDEYEKSIAMLRTQLDATKAERAQWSHRIDLLRGTTVDRDLLEEQARLTLDRVGKDELVIFLSQR